MSTESFFTLPKVASCPADGNIIIKNKSGVTQLVFELLAVKVKIKGVLPGHTVAMVTYCSPMIGQGEIKLLLAEF